jgi:putative holliday junction resolvase
VQEKQIPNPDDFTDLSTVPASGRLLALDPGMKRIGVAVSDELRLTTRALDVITRTSWKKLLLEITRLIAKFDAVAVIIGLPYQSDGTESEMSAEARSWARKFSLSLPVPIYLQDERNTSYEAKSRLWGEGMTLGDAKARTDSTAASIILADFLDRLEKLRA